MISNGQRDTGPSHAEQETVRRIDLSAFDGQRMAVLLERGAKRVVLRGTAAFVRDDAIGNVLCIRLENKEPGEPVLIISEEKWLGRIIPDLHFGCSYCLIVQ
ncbi:MAG: hypothetical protein FJ276_26245 [Planctomycetes bacterium]|nr:hypothetical protein [Planctomycetota bacterium]